MNAGNPASTDGSKAVVYSRGDALRAIDTRGVFAGESIEGDTSSSARRSAATRIWIAMSTSTTCLRFWHYNTTSARGVADGNVTDPANANGTVDFDDLLALAKNYGQSLTIEAAQPLVAARAVGTRSRKAAASLAGDVIA